METVGLSDGNASTVLAGKGANFNTLDKSQDVAVAVFRVEEFNLAVISFCV